LTKSSKEEYINTMKKKIILLIILGVFALLILVQVGLDLLQFSIYTSEPRTDSGIIVRRVKHEYEEWGLEVTRGRIIKHKEILRFSEPFSESPGEEVMALPERLKREGLKVKVTYIIGDVIGMSNEWVTYIDIISTNVVE